MRALYILVAMTLVVYLFYMGYFYFNQRTILFPRHLVGSPGEPLAEAGLERMWLATSVGQVEAWYLAPLNTEAGRRAPLCILAHGNGDLIDRWLPSVTTLRQMGMGVLLVEYPGYGRSQGEPSYTSIRETILLAHDTIIHHPQVDPARILLFGHSVGGGAVGILAAERASSGMVLLSTFSSVSVLATGMGLPGFAARDPFNNLAVVRNYQHPLLIIHGTQDRTIPYQHAVALHAVARQSELLSIECGHNGCIEDWDKFWLDLRPFLVRTAILNEPTIP